MAKRQYVWVLKPGQPYVNRKSICKMLGINRGIYTSEASDTPVSLQKSLLTLSQLAEVVEPELEKGSYTLVSFPVSAAKSKAMMMPRLKYLSRIHTHYWLEPTAMREIELILSNYNELNRALNVANHANAIYEKILTTVIDAPSIRAAREIAAQRLSTNYSTLYWATIDVKELLAKRLRGLVWRSVANPSLFTIS